MSWLGRLNYLVLQWFFVRLARVKDDGGREIGWTFLIGVIPCTGWKTPYRYLYRKSG